MIPDWEASGDLPPGIHFATIREVHTRLGFNSRRQLLMEGFREACKLLVKAGCRLVYLNGSFVSSKAQPGDFDACWDIQGVEDAALDPVFLDFSNGRAAQKQRFGGEFFPAQLPEGASGLAFLAFFQVNKHTGTTKGIVAIRLKGAKRA